MPKPFQAQIADNLAFVMPALNFDAAVNRYQTKSISINEPFTFTNTPAQGSDAILRLELTTTVANLTPTWAGVVWAGGTAPTFATAGVYEVTFSRSATTASLRGATSGRFAS